MHCAVGQAGGWTRGRSLLWFEVPSCKIGSLTPHPALCASKHLKIEAGYGEEGHRSPDQPKPAEGRKEQESLWLIFGW